jgi:hypothetical protein
MMVYRLSSEATPTSMPSPLRRDRPDIHKQVLAGEIVAML